LNFLIIETLYLQIPDLKELQNLKFLHVSGVFCNLKFLHDLEELESVKLASQFIESINEILNILYKPKLKQLSVSSTNILHFEDFFPKLKYVLQLFPKLLIDISIPKQIKASKY